MPLWIHLDGKQNYSPYTSIYVFKFCCCCLETWSKYVALDKVTVSMETRLCFYLWQWSFLWFSGALKVSLISANLIRKMWLISTFPFLLLCSLTSFWIVCLKQISWFREACSSNMSISLQGFLQLNSHQKHFYLFRVFSPTSPGCCSAHINIYSFSLFLNLI